MKQSNKEFRNTKGKNFTIIEVLIVVAIVGILAAIAIPAVTKYVTDARRSDGKVALMEAAQIMERFYTQNYEYSGAAIPTNSSEGYYELSFQTAPNATHFTIQAEAYSDGNQAGDSPCLIMTINQWGEKGPEDCW